MIDWQRVGELREDVGAEDFAEVVELFLEEVAEVVQRLTGSRDASGLEADLHLLKGCAMNLGFTKLGGVCDQCERLARSERPEAVDIDPVVATYQASLAEFQAGLGPSRAA